MLFLLQEPCPQSTMLIEIITGNTYNTSTILFPSLHFWAPNNRWCEKEPYWTGTCNARQRHNNTPLLRGDMYPQEHGPDFPFSLNDLPACGACSIWYHFDSPRSWQEEKIQRRTHASLETRLQLVTGNVKKIWKYHSKIPHFWALEKLENEARLACLPMWQ